MLPIIVSLVLPPFLFDNTVLSGRIRRHQKDLQDGDIFSPKNSVQPASALSNQTQREIRNTAVAHDDSFNPVVLRQQAAQLGGRGESFSGRFMTLIRPLVSTMA